MRQNERAAAKKKVTEKFNCDREELLVQVESELSYILKEDILKRILKVKQKLKTTKRRREDK